jgi:hypothetical protein
MSENPARATTLPDMSQEQPTHDPVMSPGVAAAWWEQAAP